MIHQTDRIRLLRIKVIAGHSLAKKDIFGASDPYVKIDLIRAEDDTVIDSVYTKTKKRTLNPVWEEEFVFRVRPGHHRLSLEVFDENRLTRDDFLGVVELPLTNIPIEKPGSNISQKYYILRPRSTKSKVKGHLQIYLAFLPSEDDPEDEGTPVTEVEPGWEVLDGNEDTSGPTANTSSSLSATATNTAGAAATATNTNSNTMRSNSTALLTPVSSTNNSSASNVYRNSSVHHSPLPLGWEERQDANGRTYYVNHIARTTQWERPSLDANESNTSANAEVNEQYAQEFRNRVHISASSNETEPDQSSIQPRRHNGSLSISTASASTTATTSSPGLAGEDATSNQRRYSEPQYTTTESTPDELTSSVATSSSTSSSGLGTSSGRSVSGSNTAPATVTDEDLPPNWSMQVAPNGRVFFIDHTKKSTTWIDPRTKKPSPLPNKNRIANKTRNTPIDDLGPLPDTWEERIHTDGRIFFIDHATRTTQWEDPRLSNPQIAGPAVPYSRDYKRKYEYLQGKLSRPNSNVPNKLEIKVSRGNIFEDSYRIISNVHRVELLKTKLWIEFDGEEVLDYGGASREWFYLLSKEMFNPYYGLFEYSVSAFTSVSFS